MDCATRGVTDRVWRSVHQHGGFRRSCSVRVAALHENRRTSNAPSAQPSAAAISSGASLAAQPATLTSPLALDRIHTLKPSELAASLLEYTQQSTLESTFQHPSHEHPNDSAANTVPPPPSAGQAATAGAGAVGDPQMYDAVARRVAECVYDFDAVSLVDVLHAYSRSGQGRCNRDVLAICCVVLSGRMDELPPAHLARLAAACAALELSSTDMLAALCSRAGEPAVLSQFSASDLVALVEALAQLQHRSPTTFADAADVIATELQLQMPRGSGQWGSLVGPAAGIGARPGAGAGAGRGLTPEQAVSAVWAMAASGLYHRQLFDGASALLMDRLGELGGNSLAKISWSYATVRHADESHRGLWDRDLFDGIAWVCLERGVANFPPRALVTLLWSFASIPHYDGPLFEAVSTQLATHLAAGRVAPSDLVAVAWSVQRVAHAHVGLMEALGQAALAAVDRLDGEDLTTIAMAFPAAKAYSEGFFKYLVAEAQARPQFFGQVALLDIIRLISRVQHRDPKYYGPVLKVLLDHVHQAFLDAPLEKSGCMNPFRFG